MRGPSPSPQPVLGMILKGYPRISETFISNEIYLLEQLGIPVHIFSLRHPREAFSHESVKRIQAGVDYLPQSLLVPLPRFLISNTQVAARRFRSYGQAFRLAVHRFRRTRKSATLKHLFQAGYLVNKLLAKHNVVHLHAHFAHSPTSVALFASKISGLPFSFTAHAKDIYTSDPTQLKEKIEMARFVLTCTDYNRRYLNSLSAHRMTPIHLSYHGLDTTLFSPAAGKGQPASPFQILTVARLTAKKGLPTVLRAIRHLLDSGLPVHHTLIGDGDDREEILTLVKTLGLQDATSWLGTQAHGTVLDNYQRADLFVLGCEIAPDGDRDGIPNVIMESMAMGVPVVATRISAIPEIIEDGVTGLLVEPGQPEAMAAAMTRLLTENDLREPIRKAARAQVRDHFDNRSLGRDLAGLYREYIDVFQDES